MQDKKLRRKDEGREKHGREEKKKKKKTNRPSLFFTHQKLPINITKFYLNRLRIKP